MPISIDGADLRQRLADFNGRLPQAGLMPPAKMYLPDAKLLRSAVERKFSDDALQDLFWNLRHALGPGCRVPLDLEIHSSMRASTEIKTDFDISKAGLVTPASGSAEHTCVAGLYSPVGAGRPVINVVVHPGYGLREVLAILAHEFCHHLLISAGVHRPDHLENEQMTDLATCWFGFGHLLYRAYHPDAVAQGGLGYVDHLTLWNALAGLWKNHFREAVTRLGELTRAAES
jgi:hypothetical protein